MKLKIRINKKDLVMKHATPTIGDIVILRDGSTGEVMKVELSGELKIKVADDYYYHFPEDVEVLGHVREED